MTIMKGIMEDVMKDDYNEGYNEGWRGSCVRRPKALKYCYMATKCR
jgi:hypothetical protein